MDPTTINSEQRARDNPTAEPAAALVTDDAGQTIHSALSLKAIQRFAILYYEKIPTKDQVSTTGPKYKAVVPVFGNSRPTTVAGTIILNWMEQHKDVPDDAVLPYISNSTNHFPLHLLFQLAAFANRIGLRPRELCTQLEKAAFKGIVDKAMDESLTLETLCNFVGVFPRGHRVPKTMMMLLAELVLEDAIDYNFVTSLVQDVKKIHPEAGKAFWKGLEVVAEEKNAAAESGSEGE